MNDIIFEKKQNIGVLWSSLALAVLGAAYLVMLILIFGTGINVEGNYAMQYLLHGVVLLTAFSFLVFVEQVCAQRKETLAARLAVIFTAMFSLLLIIGRGLAIWVISLPAPAAALAVFNFYASGESVSRTIELLGWTLIYPTAILLLGFVFRGSSHPFRLPLFFMSIASSVCCYAAFGLLIAPSYTLFFVVGAVGWGFLFEAIVVAYFIGLLGRQKGTAVV